MGDHSLGLAARSLRGLTGVLGRTRPATRMVCRGLSVFTFHDITDTPSPFQVASDIATPLKVFRTQVEWISRTFDVVDPVLLGEAEDLPANAAAITFDDSWLGTFDNGFSILEDLGLPAIAFLNFCGIDHGVDAAAISAFEHGATGGYPDMSCRHHRPPNHEGYREFQGDLANESTIRYWDGHPLFSFGSHLYWHVVSIGSTPSEFEDSYLRNARRLAEFQKGFEFLSFPFGQPGLHFDSEHVDAARRLGARKVFSARSSVNRGPLGFVIDRTSMPTADSSPGAALMHLVHRELVERFKGEAQAANFAQEL